MTVIKEKTFTNADGYQRRIQIGRSTWDKDELSIWYYYEDSRGRMCFKSPEVPMDVVVFMTKFLKEDISILPREIVDLLAMM